MDSGGSTTTSAINFDEATNALKNLADALKDWVGDALPYIIGVASAFFAFYLIRVVIRLVRSASK